MTYEKPNVDVVEFENDAMFMTASGNLSAEDIINSMGCSQFGGFSDNGKTFSCSFVGGKTAENGNTITVNGYTFTYHGNGWKCPQYGK